MKTPPQTPKDARLHIEDSVATKEARKLRARREDHSVWFGLGTFGLVGWSVSIPTLIGVFTGVWLDSHVPSRFSWTLMLLVAGIALGCWNAWYWISKTSNSTEPSDSTPST